MDLGPLAALEEAAGRDLANFADGGANLYAFDTKEVRSFRAVSQ
jgi:hypothetical protein